MKAWDDFLLLQEKVLGSATVKRWLTSLKVTGFDACNLYLEATDAFQVHWFEEHMRKVVLSNFVNKNHKCIKVHLSIAKKVGQLHELAPKSYKQETLNSFALQWDFLDPLTTLEQFIPSSEHCVAYKLFTELSEKNTLGAINPIFLSGHSGTGKTHLLMALANRLKEHGLKVIYTSAETFTEQVVSSIRNGKMQLFREAYRNSDALFIDDIETFSRKGATQEELFHTFNTLHLAGKQIILSSKLLPKDIQEIESRLISRFEWGIVLMLEPLQKESMRKLLLQKLNFLNIKFPEKTLEFFLDTFKSSTKKLFKALDALVLRSHLDHKIDKNPFALSIEMIRSLLSDLIKIEEEGLLTPTKIIKIVAEHYGIRLDDILGKSQNKECSLPRQIAMYLCREELKLPFMKIGDLFSRDHSTVMTSIKQVEKLKSADAAAASTLNVLSKALKNTSH